MLIFLRICLNWFEVEGGNLLEKAVFFNDSGVRE